MDKMLPYQFLRKSSDRASTVYMKSLVRHASVLRMQDDLENLLKDCPNDERQKYEEENRGFLKLFEKFVSVYERPIIWDEIEPFPTGSLLDYDNFIIPIRPVVRNMLKKLVVVKLNGGLGTRMKCNGPKGLIPVRNVLTFLDLTVQQLGNLNSEYDADVPLVLMNSFNTVNETDEMLSKYRDLPVKIYSFEQSRYPRIKAENRKLLPSSYNDENKEVWYPPGHGNFYESFVKSGLLEELQAEGKEYCFVSNIDNLGAVVDFRILDIMTTPRQTKFPEFIMEVTQKTAADITGGTLIHYMGKMKLLEIGQVPRGHTEEFKCSQKFTNFNTNNLWINLEAIKRNVMEDTLSLDVILNSKQIILGGKKVDIFQLETAAGSAIEVFEGALGILVPRSRFLPVKTSSDLFLLRSNVYVNDNGKLIMNSLRPFADVPLISLADEHFKDYREIYKRFEKMPDCLQLHHLTVCGNVYFAKDVVLKGNVTIVAHSAERIDVPRGSILQNKIVTGALRIVDF